jgi:hypothetical protein
MYQHLRRLLPLIAAVILLITSMPPPALAQTYALEVYTNPNYGGSLCLSNTPESANIHASCNDQISSIRLMAGWSVRVYRDQNQGGPSVCFNRSDTDLADNTFEDNSPANDAISSFRLYNQPWCGGAPTPAYPLEVYNDPGYGGFQCYSWQAEAANIYAGCNDQISSVLLRAGWSLRVYRDQSQGGSRGCLTGSDDNLADNTFFDGTPMNDAISSFRLYSQGSCANLSPNVPTPSGPANGSSHTNRAVTLSWADTGDPDDWPRTYRDYYVEIRKADNSWSTASGWQTATSWMPTVPDTGGTFIWRVQSGDGMLGSGWSGEWSFTVASVGDIVTQPQPPQRQDEWNVPYYWQGDPRWGNQKIGACNSTIAPVGCALTSLAMIFKFYGANHDPGTLNQCLGGVACPLAWSHAKVLNCSGGKVRWGSWPAFSYARLEQELKRGPVILEISKGGGYLHFIVVLKGSGSNPANYIVNDPGVKNGQRNTLSRTLALFKGYAPSSMRLYSGTPAYTTAEPQSVIAEQPLQSPLPSASEIVTGAIALYRNTETRMVLELAAQSSAGTISEVLIWTDQHSSDVWLSFGQYVSVPLDGEFYVQFRDAAGNTSAVMKAQLPSAPKSIQQNISSIYLPLINR